MNRGTPRTLRIGSIAAIVLGIAGATRTAHAHIGSPDTWFEGSAGPYPVRVVVRAPGAIPGLAEIDVRVLAGRASEVSAQARAWNAKEGLAPPPDLAQVVSGDPSLYSVPMWFMASTTYAVSVRVNGDRGPGVAIVPVQMSSLRRLPMDTSLTWILIALGLFLCVGLTTFIGAAARESVLPPGEAPDARRLGRARLAMVATAVVLTLGLTGGRRWWNNVDRAFRQELYRPFHTIARVVSPDRGGPLELTIDDPRWLGREWTPLIPDHGKIMHLFLVSEPEANAFAHLHPVMSDSNRFETKLPVLQPGRYRVYGDIVHESGFAQTLVTSVDIERSSGAPAEAVHDPPMDADDSWYSGGASPTVDQASEPFALGDGSVITWQRGAEPIVVGEERPLRFTVHTAEGRPAALEPYMGMAAHAVIMRDDGSVFAHLHPIGTISMASEMAITERTEADSVPGTLGRRLTAMSPSHAMSMGAMGPPGEFTIPYGFPQPGRYRIWVQVKRNGAIRTAAFDTDVQPAPRKAGG